MSSTVLQQTYLDHFPEKSKVRVCGTSNCVLVYSSELILRVEEQSIESRIDELIAARKYEQAVELAESSNVKPALL